MGAHTVLIQSAGSSIEKGESLLDTGYTVRAVGADIIVIRHPNAGAPYVMAQHIDVPVIKRWRRTPRTSLAGAARCLHNSAQQENFQRFAGRDCR